MEALSRLEYGRLPGTLARRATRNLAYLWRHALEAIPALLCGITLLTAGMGRSFGGLKPGDLALGLALAVVVIRRMVRRKLAFDLSVIDFGFLALILTGTLAPLITAEARGEYVTRAMAQALAGPVEYYLWYRVLLEYLPTALARRWLLYGVAGAISLISLIALLQTLHAPGIQHALMVYYPSLATWESADNHRATSLVGSWETLAALAAYALVALHHLALEHERQVSRADRYTWLYAGLLLLNLGALLATLSVAGLIAALLGLVLVWRLHSRIARAMRWALLGAALAGLAFIPLLLARLHSAGATSLTPNTWVARWQHWSIVAGAVFSNPGASILGVNPSFLYPVANFGSTESLYLLALYRGGLLYLLGCCVFIGLVIVTLWRARLAMQGADSLILSITLTVWLVNGAIDVLDAHLFSAGEWQTLVALLAGAVSASPTLKLPQPQFVKGSSPAIQRGIQVSLLGIIAILPIMSGYAVLANRHLPAPPAPLHVVYYDANAPISAENRLPGASDWQIPAGSDTTSLRGSVAQASVAPGDSLPISVSSSFSQRYHLTVYRLGWYNGLGARRMFTAPYLVSDSQAPNSYNLAIGADWPSGLYLIKLSADDARIASYVPFVVRTNQPPAGSMLVALHAPTSDTSAETFASEVHAIRWFERSGYDGAYTTDDELARTPDALRQQRVILVLADPSSLSVALRNALGARIAAGASIAFFGLGTLPASFIASDLGTRTRLDHLGQTIALPGKLATALRFAPLASRFAALPVYVTPAGGIVFSAPSEDWADGLDEVTLPGLDGAKKSSSDQAVVDTTTRILYYLIAAAHLTPPANSLVPLPTP